MRGRKAPACVPTPTPSPPAAPDPAHPFSPELSAESPQPPLELYHHSALESDAYPRLMCCSPQPIAPAPPIMRIGLDALLELLAATTTPIASVVAPIALTSDPRKLLVSNCLASASARGDDWTSFSTSKSRNQPAVPSSAPSAPRRT